MVDAPLPQPPRRPAAGQRLAAFGTTIFAEMTALANRHGAVNLGQGFPDFDGPPALHEAAVEAVRAGHNQYARSMGVLPLVEAIAAKAHTFYGLSVDPLREVCVYSGATEGLAAAILGICDPGDEIVFFEPTYDSYLACAAFAGAVPRMCPLHLPDFRFDPDALRACFGPRTRLLVLNTPHNPTGKVFDRAELETIAALCQEFGVYVLTDEVYEHLVYDDARHVPIATLPGMFERTLTLSSTGKTYSLTGWKVGYGIGPAPLIAAAQAAHQYLTFSSATPLQHALAQALALGPAFYSDLKDFYSTRRDFLVDALRRTGLDVKVPRGTYFVLVDVTSLGFDDDREFARMLTEEVGVACIPTSGLYSENVAEGRRLVRFAFCKRMETLEAAAERLVRLPELAARRGGRAR